MKRVCETYWLGRVEYGEALALQRRRAAARVRGEVEDCLLLLEHPPVITLGRGAGREHVRAEKEVLEAHGIKVWEIERGGDVTFHGPGQLVGYPILSLADHGRDIHRYVRKLEDVLIRTLQRYGLQGERSTAGSGVWTAGAKMASIGVHVGRWVSRHGFALNVGPDLSGFDLIVPCGLDDTRVISLATLLGHTVPLPEVADVVAYEFGVVFDCVPRPGTHVDAALAVSPKG